MPVLLDNEQHDHHLFRAEALSETMTDCILVGLINNMPDSAVIATERQLFQLLDAAAGSLPVRLKLYTLPNVPRGDWGRQYMGRFYSNIDDLWDRDLDGLIVTGAEPRAPSLSDEPYWDSLGQVVDWAKENTLTAVWSCLAVHAAILHLEGIDRQPLGNKCIGVFAQERMLDHPLMEDVPSRVGIPHSRWNELSEDSLTSSGYHILTKSPDAGVDMFVKLQEKSLFVFFQGHPEYEAWSLLGEYRRDIGRFLRREVEGYPTMPKKYFDEQAEELLIDFRNRAFSNRSDELLAEFPADRVAANLKNTWHSAATRIYRNWILYMTAKSTRSRKRPWSSMTRASALSH